MGNFSRNQNFFAVGQTIQFNVHFSAKETFYTWFLYHSPGRFENSFIANAKSPTTNPSQISYLVKGTWDMKEFSLGWKHYFKESFDANFDWNLYGIAGLGIMFTDAENTLDRPFDTTLYAPAPTPVIGSGTITRLTVDLGLGGEIPLGGEFYVYGDARTYLPASSYPSPYLHDTKNVPLPIMINFGVRILFGSNRDEK